MNKKAVVLLSGGLDSITCCAIAQNKGQQVYAISFDYGQRHKYELECTKKIIKAMNIKDHKLINIDLKTFGGSALTDEKIDVPQPSNLKEVGKNGTPITYVPARNTIFLSYCLAYAEVLNANSIYIGVNALDNSGYPDCSPQYIEAYQKMATIATKVGKSSNGVTIETPLLHLDKKQIIQLGTELNVDYGLTSSCYNVNEKNQACGKCDACLLRINGFEQAGIKDPIAYAE